MKDRKMDKTINKEYRGLSIKGKLLIFALCISLIPISIVTTIYYINASDTLKKQTLQWLTAVAESRETHVLEFINGKRGRTIDFSSDGFIRDSLESITHGGYQSNAVISLNRHLKVNKMPLDPYIKAIAILDTRGKVVSSTHKMWIGEDMCDREAFSQTIGKSYGNTLIEQPQYIPCLDSNCILISAPLTSREKNNTIGVIVNCYGLEALNEITANRSGMGKTGEVYLVNSDKLMLTESRFIQNTPLKQIVDTVPVNRILEYGEEMSGIYLDYRGVSIAGASVYMPEYGWILLAEVDKAEAFAHLKIFGIFALVLGLVCATVVTTIGIMFANSTSRPIRKLTLATEKLADGDLDYRVETDRKDEIGILACSFNTMAKELKALNEDLEQRVRDRTTELENKSEELHQSKKYLQDIFDGIQDGIRVLDKDMNIIKVNRTMERWYSHALPLPGKKCFQTYNGKTGPCTVCPTIRAMEKGTLQMDIVPFNGTKGRIGWQELFAFPLKDDNGNITGVIEHVRDVTKRLQAEEQIKTSLREKEILIGEIYHRTKNNMQVICSLLNLQSKYIKDEQTLTMFKEIDNRIKTMSLVHSKLYQSKDLSNINLKSYIDDLAHNLLRAYQMGPDKISLKVRADDVLLTIDSAIPCGLVINEIITNSLKYAFPDNREGEIIIDLRRIADIGLQNADYEQSFELPKSEIQNPESKMIELRIADNGIGIPEGFDFRKTDSFGLKIVFGLIENQLNGKVVVNTEKGVEFIIRFKESDWPERI